MNCSFVAIAHPEFENLFLHGKRRDNNKWTLPGGKANAKETPKETAIRELKEETGLSIPDLTFCCTKTVKKGNKTIKVSLFKAKCPKNLNLKVSGDPDLEMDCFKFLDPLVHQNMHVPLKDNVLKDFLSARK